ncbi:MAG: DUF2231 domain-containing protein [Spirochaetia bacterium]
MKGLKLLGHPVHPAIVHFPVAGWTAAVVTDALSIALRDPLWWRISQWLLILFIIAALGGFLLFGIDVATKKPPKWLGFVHGAVAVAGFIFLLVFAFAGGGGS